MVASFCTAPMSVDPHGAVVLVSQVCQRDLQMYLLAMKSLLRFLPARRIVAVDDLSLRPCGKAQLSAHLPGIELIGIDEINVGRCPTGGTWERLLTIVELCQDAYVIQVDSDTLTLSNPELVHECIQSNRPFAEGTRQGCAVEPVLASAERAQRHLSNSGNHVQMLAEASFSLLPNANSLRYVRGCSGFSGFSRGVTSRRSLEWLSQQMERLIGRETWRQWGSEQVASNFVVANGESPVVLPVDTYGYLNPRTDLGRSRFVHCVGSYRFRKGTYARLANRIIDELLARS